MTSPPRLHAVLEGKEANRFLTTFNCAVCLVPLAEVCSLTNVFSTSLCVHVCIVVGGQPVKSSEGVLQFDVNSDSALQ